MINVIGITTENTLDKDVSIHTLNLSQYKWVWVDFNAPTDEEIKHLSHTFNFHPLAIEDCIHVLQRPKLDHFEDHAFYVTHVVREIENELMKDEIDFFVSENYIVTFHRMPSKEIEQTWNKCIHSKKIETWDTNYVFYQILDKIVDNYFPLIYKIEDELDKIENNSEKKSMNLLMDELFDKRYWLLYLRHTVNPMRDLLYKMLNSHELIGIRDKKEYFSDIYDHLLKLSEMVMSNRELTSDIRDSYLSMNSHQTNNVMKVLTIITSIFVPLTFIAGIYGMNFEHMPELSWQYGYFISLGVMGGIGLALFLWFKSRGWFD
ncbi:magnesium/cobalt transporter CorA [Bacillus timonensis]|nr:magnesium/cobalt transporter CorA [Bacillus timonensis]